MSTPIPTTFSGQEMVSFHRYRLAEQIDEWVTEALADLTAAKKLSAEMRRKSMVKTEEQEKTLAAVEHVIQCALEAGQAPMLQFSSEVLSDFLGAFEDEGQEGEEGEGEER
jgi:hypothetical protein